MWVNLLLRRAGTIPNSEEGDIFTNAFIISTAAKAKVVVKVVHLNVPVAQVTLDRRTQSQQSSSTGGHVEARGSHCAKPIRIMGILGTGAERAARNLDRNLPMIESDERVRNDLIAEH